MAFKYERRTSADIDKRATQQGGDFQGFIKDEYKTYQPHKGDNCIRILPPTWEKPHLHYGCDAHVHYQIGPDKASVLCNFKQFNKPCAICEARVKAEQRGDEELAKNLKPSRRVCVWVLDLKEPEKGVLMWAMPWTLDRDLAKISKDKRDGQIYYIDDPDEGYDVMFDKEGEGMTTKYTGLQLARRPSSVADKWLDYVQDNPIPETFNHRTYDEVVDLYTGGMGPEALSGRAERPSRDAPERGGRERDEPRSERETPRPSNPREADRDREQPRRDGPQRDRDEQPARDRDEPRRSDREEEPRRARRTIDDDEPKRDDRDEPRRSAREEDPAPRRRIIEDKPERRPARDDRDEPREESRRSMDRTVKDDEIPFEKSRARDEPRDDAGGGKSRADLIRERLAASRNN